MLILRHMQSDTPMKFLIVARWPSPDVLSTSTIYESATAALRAAQQMKRQSMQLRIEVIGEEQTMGISLYKLYALSRAESGKSPIKDSRKSRRRKKLASILLGILASALPNGFGDFGVLGGNGGLRAGRVALAGTTPRNKRGRGIEEPGPLATTAADYFPNASRKAASISPKAALSAASLYSSRP